MCSVWGVLDSRVTCVMTGTLHVMGKQPVMGGDSYVMLNGQKECIPLHFLENIQVKSIMHILVMTSRCNST